MRIVPLSDKPWGGRNRFATMRYAKLEKVQRSLEIPTCILEPI